MDDEFTTISTTDAFSVQFIDNCINSNSNDNSSYENHDIDDLGEDISRGNGTEELVSSMYLEHAEAELSEQGRTSGSDAYMVDRKCVKKIKSKSKKKSKKHDPQTVAYAVDELYDSERGLVSST